MKKAKKENIKKKHTQNKEKASKTTKTAKITNKKSLLSLSFWKKFILIAGGIIFAFSFVVFIYNLNYANRVFPNTFLGEDDLGGKNYNQLKTYLQDKFSQTSFEEITLNYKDQKWFIRANDAKVKYNLDETTKSIWSIGRKGSFGKVLKEQTKAVFKQNKAAAVYDYDESSLNKKVDEISAKVDEPEKDATIVIENLIPKVQDEKIGKRLNKDRTNKSVKEIFAQMKPKAKIELSVETVNPKITVREVEPAYKQTQKVLSESVLLKSEKKEFKLEPKDFSSWLDFSTEDVKDNLKDTPILIVKVNQDKINKYFDNISGDINQEAKDARFDFKDGRAIAFQVSQTGYELEKDKAKEMVSEAILGSKKTVTLPIKVVKPTVTASSAEDMGIKEIVGEGTTNFSGSPANRRQNINVGAKALHGLIIMPGQEFATVPHLSPIDASKGYVPELVIKDNRTVPEYGGGLCQVSTTLFRAALNTGLKITDRSNHSYRVSYYEPPVGMDATIYDPKPDFKFVNNMDHPILIQSKVEGNNITFTMYGTKDSRKVEVSTPVLYDVTPPGDPIYVEDPKLAAGEIKKVESAHNGAKAYFNYKVTKDSQILQQQKFTSSYVPWTARYLYGPGTQIPQ